MTALNDRFWAKVLFKEYIRHYRKLTDEQKVADINASMDALEELDDSGNSFGSKMVKWSMDRVDQYPQASENGKKGGRPRKNSQDAPNGNAGVDRKSATSCDQFTADGDIREDSQDRKSGTSANHYGDAPHREAGDESATVSNPLALDSLTRQGQTTAKTRDSHGSGRYQPPSLGPEDGNLYDQKTIGISTNRRRTGGPSLSQTSSSPCANGPAKHPYGEFGNVMLTTEEFQKFVTAEGSERANGLIEELSSYLASSGKRYKSHYATLLNWARRKKDEAPRQRYMTADDISRRNAEEGWRQLQLMHAQGNG